ncbi:hypothetical protein PFISCL1PPCAC_20968, partial [Pristionchus fissidentatus]
PLGYSNPLSPVNNNNNRSATGGLRINGSEMANMDPACINLHGDSDYRNRSSSPRSLLKNTSNSQSTTVGVRIKGPYQASIDPASINIH